MRHKAQEIENRIRRVRDAELNAFARKTPKGPGFAQALANDEHLSVIAEIKRRSPSAGTISADTNAAEQARIYVNGGADALSVLTDEKYFGGSLQDLWDVFDLLQTRESPPPALRKDFMLHPVQILDAAEAGARAILIIVRALDDETIKTLYNAATLAGLDSLFEIHNEAELEKALRHDPKIIGVNNRDLETFTTNLNISENLIPQIPEEIITISESGIFDPEDAERAAAAGADAVLVGEALMRAEGPEELIQAFQDAG